MVHAELADREGRAAPQVTVLELDSGRQLAVAIRGGPAVLHVSVTCTSLMGSSAAGVARRDINRSDGVAVLLGRGSLGPQWAASLPLVHSAPADLAASRLRTFAGEIDAPHEAVLLLTLRWTAAGNQQQGHVCRPKGECPLSLLCHRHLPAQRGDHPMHRRVTTDEGAAYGCLGP